MTTESKEKNKLEKICEECKGARAAFIKGKYICPYTEKAKEQGSVVSVVKTAKSSVFYFECTKPMKDYAQLGVGG